MTEPLIARMRGFGTTIFSEMTGLAIEHDAVNLGQGFPDENPPDHVVAAAHAAVVLHPHHLVRLQACPVDPRFDPIGLVRPADVDTEPDSRLIIRDLFELQHPDPHRPPPGSPA
jgi:hypothetical protein